MAKPHIVMVHGSWHWGGCFQKVADRLSAMGFPVSTPDLASHGYSDVRWQDVGSMENYTAPVRAVLDAIGEPVILVGHSMGGVSLTHLAETVPEKIRTLVYLTAFMTPVGKTAQDYIVASAEDPVTASLFAVLKVVDDGAGIQADLAKPDLVRDAFYGHCSETDTRVALANVVVVNTLVPNFYVPKSLSNLPRHYISCSQDHAIPLAIQKRMIEEVAGTTVVHQLSSDHSPFFCADEQLCEILRTIAEG